MEKKCTKYGKKVHQIWKKSAPNDAKIPLVVGCGGGLKKVFKKDL